MPAVLNWTPEEDELLRELVEVHGTKAWAKIAARLRTKGSKQCRRRWKNSLNMNAKTCSWTAEEDATLIDAHRRLGNRWTEISKIFGDRTDNAVKNRWHALTRKHPNLEGGAGGGGDEEDSDEAPRSGKRRRTRGSARTEDDSDHPDSGRYGGQSLQYTSSGGLSAAALPTPFDQVTRVSRGGRRGKAAQQLQPQQSQQANHDPQQQAAWLQQQHLQQQQQQQQQQQAQLQAPSLVGQPSFYGNHVGVPLQITVSKDFLTPWEQQLADQINAMNLPVHVEVAPAPIPVPLTLAGSSLALQSNGLVGQDLIGNRSSWRQYVEKLDDPGDSRGLQELLDWFGGGNGGVSVAAPAAPGQNDSSKATAEVGTGFGSRRLTRSLSKSRSGSGSGDLSGDHRQLLVKLMSRGLEARSSSEQEAAVAAAADGGPPRVDPLRRTRSSSSGKSTQERERAAAAAATAVQQSGLAAAAAAGANGGLRPPPSQQGGGQGRGRSRANSLSVPLIEPSVVNPVASSDVLVTPSFSSQEIALLIDTLKPKL